MRRRRSSPLLPCTTLSRSATTVAGASRAARSTDRDSHGRWLWRLVRPFGSVGPTMIRHDLLFDQRGKKLINALRELTHTFRQRADFRRIVGLVVWHESLPELHLSLNALKP